MKYNSNETTENIKFRKRQKEETCACEIWLRVKEKNIKVEMKYTIDIELFYFQNYQNKNIK